MIEEEQCNIFEINYEKLVECFLEENKYMNILKLQLMFDFDPDIEEFIAKRMPRSVATASKCMYESVNISDNILLYNQQYRTLATNPTDIITRLIEFVEAKAFSDLNSIVFLRRNEMIKEAIESTNRYALDSPRSILEGVPFFVNENFTIKNTKIKMGLNSTIRSCETTSPLLVKLQELGAICCGYTTMTLMGINPFGVNPYAGERVTRNPFNTKYYIAGGEPGNASVVCSGLCPFAISFEKFGSTRLSAGAVGVKCLRPTAGSLIVPQSNSEKALLWQTSIVARSAIDLSIVFNILKNVGNQTFRESRVPEESTVEGVTSLVLRSLKGVKFGYFREYMQAGIFFTPSWRKNLSTT